MDSDDINAPAFPLRALYGSQPIGIRLPDETIIFCSANFSTALSFSSLEFRVRMCVHRSIN